MDVLGCMAVAIMTDQTRGETTETHTAENLRGILPLGPLRPAKIVLFLVSLALFVMALELM